MDESPKPLAGKRVVVTRAREQAGELTRALEHLGAEVLPLPAVAFAPAEDSAPLDRALQELRRFGWVLFTSQNAVRFTAMRLKQLGLAPVVQRVAAVGPATAEAARQEGFHVDYLATDHTAHSLAIELRDTIAAHSVFLPRSDRSDPELAHELREMGADVTDVIAYRTVGPEAADPATLRRIREADFDVAIFSSPSAFQNTDALLGAGTLKKLAEHVRYAAIGPTTAKAMLAAGVPVRIEAQEASAAGLADAIVKYFQDHPLAARRS
jgi:uroporphyrinogen III methyltransferase / synthase